MPNSTNTKPQTSRRAVINGVLLSYKQTEQFNHFMANSPEFRERYMKLSLGLSA
jgi:hypothetical protein